MSQWDVGFASRSRSAVASRSSWASLQDVERLIVQAVDTAYYQVQLGQERIRVAQADEKFSRDQLDETEKLRAAGRATVADVNNFRVRMLAAQANVTASEGLRDTGLVVLVELMGLTDAYAPRNLEMPPLEEETEYEMTTPEPEPQSSTTTRMVVWTGTETQRITSPTTHTIRIRVGSRLRRTI